MQRQSPDEAGQLVSGAGTPQGTLAAFPNPIGRRLINVGGA